MEKARERWFPALGALLGLGAPAGYLLLRAVMDGRLPSGTWLAGELVQNAVTYIYLTTSTIVVLTVLGAVVGRLCRQLRISSSTDALTGLFNRRHLQARLRDEVRRAARYGRELSVLAIDIDRLKEVNDGFGHDAGDDALRRVADAIRGSCRQTDVPIRYGGDEFLVLTPDTNLREATRLAERIRRAVAGATGRVPLSVSIGVAELAGLPVEARNARCLLSDADDALYRAKELGRDRVVSALECS